MPLSIKKYATEHPRGLVSTVLNDLTNTSSLAKYGPPYNKNGTPQGLGPISPAGIEGVTIPINTRVDFVIKPLQMEANIEPYIQTVLSEYENATNAQRNIWGKNALLNLKNAKDINGMFIFPNGNYGPIPYMLNYALRLAKSGLYGRALTRETLGNNSVYTYNYLNRLLFLQGAPLFGKADKAQMLGDQWGILKEYGPYPGPWWLGIYTFLYQIPPFSTSASGDLMAFSLFSLIIMIFTFLPLIPGLRKIPYYIPVYKIIWRRYYHDKKTRKD
jgi:hypothetical protein